MFNNEYTIFYFSTARALTIHAEQGINSIKELDLLMKVSFNFNPVI